MADVLEKAGELRGAWEHVAEVAQSAPRNDPVHDRLLMLEQRMTDAELLVARIRPRPG